jgi:two-component system, chemotaxis family, protein-glutamate methylesterase/glutaminase
VSPTANTIRVLVVEDSLTVREKLIGILAAEPGIEVVGVAEDGKRAIELCRQTRPDVISMDMMLPVMSGLSATEYIMAHCPTPILVVSASLNRGELFKIYEMLAAGAVDVLEKPIGTQAADSWDRRYVAMLKLVARIRVITHPRARLAGLGAAKRPAPPSLASSAPRLSCCEVVAIGASTGGPGAILEILRSLPAEFRLPILLVLHINEPFGAAFADWLDAQTARPVCYGRDGMPIAAAAGRVVVAPANRHMTVRDGRLRLTDDAERHSCRPSVDVLFETVAAEYGPRAAACLLTGMGRDGALGLLQIRRAGGVTIAQDEATSVIYGMPREAALIGAATHVLSLPDIGAWLAALPGEMRPTLAEARS